MLRAHSDHTDSFASFVSFGQSPKLLLVCTFFSGVVRTESARFPQFGGKMLSFPKARTKIDFLRKRNSRGLFVQDVRESGR